MTTAAEPAPLVAGAGLVPDRYVVTATRRDTHDTSTLWLRRVGTGGGLAFSPGQFTMLLAFGVGEVPISISGDPGDVDVLQHTVRAVGGVSRALTQADTGTVLGVRGPFGRGWDVEDARGGDVVVVAGGIGLAPLRPAVLRLCAERAAYDRVTVLYGARSPREALFGDELRAWAHDHDVTVEQTVDVGPPGWTGRVGLVTQLIGRAALDPARTLALVCGPEVMMRFAAQALLDRGVPAARIRLSVERSMQCGVGLCGHCQLRELFVCVDGPVLAHDRLAPLLAEAGL